MIDEAGKTEYPRGFTPTPDSESPLYQLHLSTFEGPLDLLLYLIKKHDIDIFDIPLAFVTRQYLASLDTLSDLDIDIAAGFLTLAAELAHIKSRMLVPREESEEDGDGEVEDPRAELVRRLLEYQKFKDAGEQLSSREILGRDSFARMVSGADDVVIVNDAALEEVAIFRLIQSLDRLLAKGKLELKHQVIVDNLSVADRLGALINRLKIEPQIAFSDLFSGLVTVRQIILTFLALLEVAKLKLIRLHQVDSEADGEIHIRVVPEMLRELEDNPAGLLGGDDEYR
jgi:segregation and condensation protein A